MTRQDLGAHDVVDEFLALIEPDATLRDDALAMPNEYAADLLYGWPIAEVFVTEGSGALDEDQFRFRVAWAVEDETAIAESVRTRATTLLIRDKAQALAALVRSHRSGEAFEFLQVDGVDYQLVTKNVRGFVMDLSGYVLRS